MRSVTTLEPKKHGDSLFPFASYKVRYPKDSVVLDLHWHSQIEFFVVTEGAGVFYLQENEIILHEGEGIVIGSGILHRGYTLEGRTCSFVALVFDPSILSGSDNDRIKIKYIDPVVNSLNSFNPMLTKDVVKKVTQISEIADNYYNGYELDIKICLLQIFSLLYKLLNSSNGIFPSIKESDKLKNIKEALLYIHKNYSKNLTISEIAKIAGMSEAYFSRTFKLLVDKTVFEYLNYYRINSAVQLLKETKLPVSIISQKVGFESSSYFIKRFKMLLGVTPSSYRSRIK
ncbi:MAG: AraC family transcriptional regulator [Spirochaetales bacterium]|nr:AraC family transcriptional regulator [Spirochaetales bacterium]